ncbi:MAG: glycosyltransferase family 2 protein [Candidatus Shapirobacteria bacterium]|nr:glycosyltransferase family 2 protein [Candidatus Shapirobacteria bacterium]
MSNEKLDLIIVNYNSTEQLIKLIKSTKLISSIINIIFIIDNDSNDFDKKYFQKSNIKIIKNKRNLGFATAVNKGVKKSISNIILLLNPDTYLIDNSIKNTFKLIKENKKIGIAGGKIKYPNNKIYPTANTKPTFLTGLFEFTNLKRIFPKNKFSKNFWIENTQNIKKPIEVSSLCGAYLFFRRKINKKLNLFNENFFMYLEDIEFGIKNNQEGYKVIFDPNSEIIHIGGVSSKNKYKTSLNYWYKSRKIFFKKYLGIFKGTILSIIFSIEEIILKVYHYIKHEPTE